MAEHALTTPTAPTRRRRAGPAQVGGVDRLPTARERMEAIAADVTARSRQQSAETTRRLREVTVLLQERHRERANDLIPIAMKMDRATLDDFIEIGERMTGGRGRL